MPCDLRRRNTSFEGGAHQVQPPRRQAGGDGFFPPLGCGLRRVGRLPAPSSPFGERRVEQSVQVPILEVPNRRWQVTRQHIPLRGSGCGRFSDPL